MDDIIEEIPEDSESYLLNPLAKRPELANDFAVNIPWNILYENPV